MNVRLPAVSNQFYSGSKENLKLQIEEFLNKAKNFKIKPKCIIVPHAGYEYSGKIAAFGYKQLLNLTKKNWKIILLGPSHYFSFFGAVFSNFEIWRTPFGDIKAIQPKISEQIFEFTEAHIPEHCLEVQMPFLQYVLKNIEIMPLLLGEINPRDLAKEINSYLDKNTLLVISSDLSHYHSYKDAYKIDTLTNNIISNLDIENAKQIDACGKTAIITGLYLAKLNNWKCKLLAYANSGDMTNEKNKVVGYSSFAFY
ncbi:MAG: AmmeMemoRadiSam system protein B [Candidatus Nanoarchaeia archaeon]